ncbi:bromodomain adjacent to zinc finger domain protein 1A-like [Anopheles maculipalpis]|uniref:bromodomain adjacent to zinc finger domain protein 1A-like n=1 Tax=Anopheles maculipalpis TaxID=1496333 RepID=UPI00215976A1|nr:bromodomain adjacent to zinc finger domain protein 1A-like [Anopheles maculipalpis]
MPLLKRKALQKNTESEHLKDSDEVFVCETTGELFSNYDDFFMRTMLLSSTVWSCVMTGRTNLTYADALESEKTAKRTLKSFPAALKGPILLIASRTKRTAIHDLASDVHGYAKDVFFKGETVCTKTGDPEVIRKAKIVRVVISDPAGDEIPSRLVYHVESVDGESPSNYSVRGEAIMRERNCLSREKCKLFLKQHVELGANQMLCVKKKSLEQFVTSKGCTDEKVFYGQNPDFQVSKKLQLQDKRRDEAQKPPKSSKKAAQKQAKQTDKENKKQSTIDKYLKQAADGSVGVQKVSKAQESKQARREEHAVQKELAKKRMKLERTLLQPQVALAQKVYSSVREDLELTDQRVFPPARDVRTLIGEEHFPDFLFILEFMNTFGDILGIETKFPNGISMEQLERALLQRDPNGPLCDILQIFLSASFGTSEASEESPRDPAMKKLRKWCQNRLALNIHELPLDWTTVSEILRLQLVAQNHLSSLGDASFMLNRDHPHILRTLTTQTVFQLSTKDVMLIICALIHHLLMTEEVLGRVEEIGEAAAKFKNNHLDQRRLVQKQASQKHLAYDNFKKELASKDGQLVGAELEDFKNQLEQKLKTNLKEIENEASTKLKELQDQVEAFKLSNCFYQVYLGSDRAFRHYWQFQSLPGLFVEHDTKLTGRCMELVTKHIPGLVRCEPKMRKKFISFSILKCAGNSDGLIDIDADGNLKCEEDVYEKLLYRGSSLLAQSKTNPLLLEAANGSVKADSESAGMKTIEIGSLDKCPTNRELLMCTGDEKSCPVHTSINGTASWKYYATAEELDALISSLNPWGVREKSLRETLELYRDFIASHIEKCPIGKLSVQENDPSVGPHNSDKIQYNETLETMLREYLVDLEVRISEGCLGELKVNDVEKWRNAILNNSYDSQITEPLMWGQQRIRNEMYDYVKKKNQESSSEASDEEDTDFLESSTGANGPTQGDEHQDKVRSLASALVQIAQSINPKFLRYPFGPKGVCRDRNAIIHFQSYGQKRLHRWEVSVMRSNSISQLFLHYHILYDAIRWSRSILRVVCMVCRLKGDASLTLLCDECNRACHMYCLKPKLKQIPEGDWFCAMCRPEDHAPKPSTGVRKRVQLKNYTESDEESEDDSMQKNSDDEDGSNDYVSEAEMESEHDKTSSDEEENDEDVEDEEEEETVKPKIVFNKKVKKVNATLSTKQPGRKRTANVKSPETQRNPPKRSRQQDESSSQKEKSSDNTNRPSASAGRRSMRLSGRC